MGAQCPRVSASASLTQCRPPWQKNSASLIPTITIDLVRVVLVDLVVVVVVVVVSVDDVIVVVLLLALASACRGGGWN